MRVCQLNPKQGTIKHVFRTFFLLVLLMSDHISVLAQTPSISSFTTNSVCQGSAITISGANFTNASAVKCGTLDAASFTVNNDNTITAVVADFATSGVITITTPGGTGTSGSTLTILPSPKPALTDIGTRDAPFTNCDGNNTYQLKVSNSSTTYGSGNAYQINWGDNTAAFSQTDWPANAQTTHTYTAQGYFTITITITPQNGCAKTATYQFYNGKNPLASFTTSNPTTGLCIPAPVEFVIGNWFNNSTGTTYKVIFGDGSPSVTLQHPLNNSNTVELLSHIYNTSSCPAVDFTAKLEANNGCFTTTYTLNQIIVRKKPVANFSFSPSPACVNTPVCFTNQTTNGYSGNSCNTTTNFSWDFGDGTTSTAQTPPCHTYASPGTYTVSLTASNSACGSDGISKTVTVASPSPPPVVTSPLTYCRGQAASQLTATGTGLVWYTSATGGSGSPVAPTPSTITAGTFTYYVSQTLPNSCESPRVPIIVTVNATPAAPAVTSPVLLCENQTASPLTATGTGLLWYTAATGGTNSSTPPTPSTSNTGTTNYYVSQTVNGCESPRAMITVTVGSLPAAPVVNSPINYCQNQPATPLTATGTGLLWYTGQAGGAGSPVAPTPVTSSPGSTTYYVSQTTACGEGPRTGITVIVNASPSAGISYTPTVLCNVANTPATPNAPIAVTQTGNSGGVYTVSPTGLPINATTGEINPAGAAPGNYTIRYTVAGTGGCTNFVATATVTVSGTPNATISYPAICTSDGAVRVNHTGTAGGSYTTTTGLTIDQTTGTITPATSTPGTYAVTYTVPASPPCPGFTTSTNVTVSLAPSAAISYNPATLCNVVNTPGTPNAPVAVTQTGTTGGVYSVSPAGLPVNTNTGEINPSGAQAGTYTIKYSIPGAGGCTAYNVTTTVTVNSTPVAAISYPGSPFCRGNNIPQRISLSGTSGGTFSAAAGLSLNASTGDINPSLSTPGIYTVTYTIAAAPPCPGFVTTTTVQIDDSPVITFLTATQSICSGGTAVFSPSSTVANTIYNWSLIAPLPSGVTGVSSGSVSGPNAAITLSFTNTGPTGQSLTIQVKPVNQGQNPCAGAPYNLTLIVNPIPAAPLVDTLHLCMGTQPAAISITSLPGTTIKWYDQNGVLLSAAPIIPTTNPAQFTYYVSQSYASGCESPKSKAIAVVHPTPVITSSSYTNPTACGTPSGSIVLNLLDLNGNPIPNAPLIVHYTKFQTPLSYVGNTNASGNVTVPLTAGAYSQISVETYGCASQQIPDVFVLKDPNPPAQPVAGYNPPICSETPLILTALSPTSTLAGPIDYVWAGHAFGPTPDTVRNTSIIFPSAAVSDAGTYVVYAMQNNCISAATSILVDIKQSPSKPVIVTRAPLCVGDKLFLQAYSSMQGANPVLNYLWKGPGTGFPVNAPNAGINNVKVADGGIYSITVSSPATGCSSTSDTMIQIGGYPIVKFPQDSLTLPTGFLLPLTPVITNAADAGILPIKNVAWTPSQDIACNDVVCASPIAAIKNNKCFIAKATNIYGCSGSDTLCVKVYCNNSQVLIANAFTPHGNVPENTKLIVRATGIVSVKAFRVFNRWGRIVFERNNFPPNDASFGWDGQVNGKPGDSGVYIYTIDVMCENGVPYTYKGNVTLL
ncbi:PKD domain-containing protein [Niastella sp. OAS944]|uniref:Ig-like domain-containing protein n=1 Tax=Niastella sp. OAS944 TaxID=2664089 RepID=UPI0034735D2D|nr:PKD repeat protein [Chitinophagaceae bacterium OAS944]